MKTLIFLIGATTFSIVTLSITTLSIIRFNCGAQHERQSEFALSVIMLNAVMLSVAFTFCCAECHYADSLSAIMLSATLLSIALSIKDTQQNDTQHWHKYN
jgi:hypothetical protein